MSSAFANDDAIDLDHRRHGKKRSPAAAAALTAAAAATIASIGEARDASNRAASAIHASNSAASWTVEWEMKAKDPGYVPQLPCDDGTDEPSAIVTAAAIEPAAVTVSIVHECMSLIHQSPEQRDRGEDNMNDMGKRPRRAGAAASTSASVKAGTSSSEAVPASGALVSKSLSISPATSSSEAGVVSCFDAQSFRSRGQTDEGKKKLRLAFTTVCGIYDCVHGLALVCKDSGEVVPELGKHNFSMLVAKFPSYCENRHGKDILGIKKPGTFSDTVYHELVHVQKSLRKGETRELLCLFTDICKLGDELIG
jgi:hypothetical protein